MTLADFKKSSRKAEGRKAAVKRKVKRVVRARKSAPRGLGAVAGSVTSFVRDTVSNVADRMGRNEEEE